MHKSVGVRCCLAERGLNISTICPLCHTELKTISHAFRDCIIVKSVWQHLGQQRLNQRFYSQELRDWLISNANLKAPFIANGIPSNVVFSFAVWLIWKQRNQVVFNHKSPNPNICRLIKMQATEFFLCLNNPKCNHQMITKLIKWERPESGWLKLNTDGSFDDLLGNAGGGGLIRDEQG